jgi:hypothetical protein
VCDGRRDCRGGDDEQGCRVVTKTCLAAEFECDNGECIHPGYLCNGFNDCDDGSDESSNICSGNQVLEPSGCTSTQFECPNGRCLSLRVLCNGLNDCGDNTDEAFCGDRGSGSANIVAGGNNGCKGYQCSDFSYCIRPDQVCDGIVDCFNFDDEDDCNNRPGNSAGGNSGHSNNPPPPAPITQGGHGSRPSGAGNNEGECPRKGEVACDEQDRFSPCIPLYKFCDQVGDCPDNADEDIGRCLLIKQRYGLM